MHEPGTPPESHEPVQVTVERAGARDLPEVMELTAMCPDAPRWPASAWERFVQQVGEGRHDMLLLARSPDRELLGWLCGTQMFEVAELEFVLVRPSARGRGMGRRLLLHWMQEVQEAGASELLLEVRPSNRAAVKLYQTLGFTVQGLRRGYYNAPREDALLMQYAVGHVDCSTSV